jgi:Protein of unknown function (DUF2013)
MLILKLLYLIFTTEELFEFFYTNDLCVLVDVVLRELCDLGDENDAEAVSGILIIISFYNLLKMVLYSSLSIFAFSASSDVPSCPQSYVGQHPIAIHPIQTSADSSHFVFYDSAPSISPCQLDDTATSTTNYGRLVGWGKRKGFK